MSLEIYVAGDIELALGKLKQKYKRDLAKDVVRHSYYLSPGQRKRLKRKRAISRLKKLEARSISRSNEARRIYGKRQTRMDHVGTQRRDQVEQGREGVA